MLQVTPKNRLAKLRRQARKRSLRVLQDRCGNFTVVSTKIEPPRPLLGLDHVPLWAVEQAISTPLPEPPPRRKRMARVAAVQDTPAAPAEACPQAAHSFLSLVEVLRTKGSAS
jgi:hypothetical protein